jgi:hypothetical protein
VAVGSKRDFLQSLKRQLAEKLDLPKYCAACECELIYASAVFQVFDEPDRFVVPIGFCPQCDGLPEIPGRAVA